MAAGSSSTEQLHIDQLEVHGTRLDSPAYWDTDDDNDGCGPRPHELYGTFTWTIENFSQIYNKELCSNAFDVGGDKWFWKKEHDWGWKKFIELSRVLDGFLVDDVLTIRAQVQVIREKLDRPFRCLDELYRKELSKVYLTNVESIVRRFIEERRRKISKLINDERTIWSSLRAFWLETDPSSRQHLARENTGTVLRPLVKHFFVEKEVTSTLMMDALYAGLKVMKQVCKNREGTAGVQWPGEDGSRSTPMEVYSLAQARVNVVLDGTLNQTCMRLIAFGLRGGREVGLRDISLGPGQV
ncbi:hypothetical protein C2845_PM17G05070 [Panicum miliaceum]|uniref:MATH domain-containing protein n=1 Tax=Panicum miliaceum TaxID=4540 RepID=A0A3L6Q1V6_PANMI|nr:hypothetical protein C2845_PM17G05070 [Panicum miliaceum]